MQAVLCSCILIPLGHGRKEQFQSGDKNSIQKVIIVFLLLHVAALAAASSSTYLQ